MAAATLLTLAPDTAFAGNGDDGAKQETQPMSAAEVGAKGHNGE